MMNTNRQEVIPTETTRSTGSGFQRLSVNINAESAEILRMVKTTRGINSTEALRRAIGLLGMFERAAARPASAESDQSFEPGVGSAVGNERW